MTLGWALLVIAAVWLIEKHHLWKRVAKIAGVLLVLAVVLVGVEIAREHHQEKFKQEQATKLAFDPAQPIDLSAGIVPKPNVDCFDPKTGKLRHDVLDELGGTQTDCGPYYIARPAGQCKRLVKGDIFDKVAHENGAIDCYLP